MGENDIKLKITKWEEQLNNNEIINISELKELEEQVSLSDLKNNTKVELCNKLVNLRVKTLNLIRMKTTTETDRITFWQVFVEDMMALEGIDKIQDLIRVVDENKDKIIKKEEIEEIEQLYADCLPIAHEKLSTIYLGRFVKEVNKKIKLFNNRVSRNIEDDFGSWIKQLRLAKGYSLKELEKKSGVTSGYIHRLENGSRKTPSIPVAESLAIGLGVSPEEFLAKLNFSSPKSVNVNLSITELVALSQFTINGVKINRNQKTKLIDVLNLIISSTPSSSFNDGVNLINKVNEFQKSLLENE